MIPPKDMPEKPTPLVVIPAAIPAELQARAQWVVWRYVLAGAKWTKPPYQATGPDIPASTTDPRTWTTFDIAVQVYLAHNLAGVGYVLTADDGYVGVDLDHCTDEDGTPEPWAAQIVQALGSYAERSPSGTGIRIFCRGHLPPGRRKNGRIEVYDGGRYLTCTGRRIPGTPTDIMDRTEVLAELVRHITPAPRPARRHHGAASTPEALYRRVLRYLAKCPPAISGQGGHCTTMSVARAIVWRFGLGQDAGYEVLAQHYNPRCLPPWSERELRHKCASADVGGTTPRGEYLMGRDTQ